MKSLHQLAVAITLVASTSAWAAPPAAPRGQPTFTYGRSIQNDTSRPMREILAELDAQGIRTTPPDSPFVPNIILDAEDLGVERKTAGTPNVQTDRGGTPAPSTIVSFTGLSTNGSFPPDTTGDVSPTHFFQWVNTRWSLFNKTTGATVQPATNGNSFFAGFGGLCQTTNQGDPLVLWDDAAQRWVVSQFAFVGDGSVPPFLQCVAVSATSDPLGSYHRYAFTYPIFNDYGKIGIWRTADNGQNAYLLTMHEFGASFVGTSFSAIERDKMLVGQPAQFLRVAGIDAFGALPFHLEGTSPMPAGACPVFAHFSFSGNGYRMWDFCIDWGGSQITNFNATPTLIPGQAFVAGTVDIPQMGTATVLDAFDGNSMYMATLRAFPATGPQEAIAAMTHIVNAGNGKAGQKWVQFGFRRGAETSLFQDGFESVARPRPLAKRIVQEGTYSPDANHRWMGSINIDQNGNLGLGYNVSGATTNPVIRINGRDASDPPNTLRIEQNCTPATTGAQTGGTQTGRPAARWGDYSTTSVDPTDDCTFWHTGEFHPVTSSASWSTRVCSFKFPSCGQPALQLEVTPPTQLAVCSLQPADPVIQVRVGVLGGLTGNTTLSASAFPAGVVPAFNPASVAPGGSSEVTLTGARLQAPGEYTGTLTGTNGAVTDSETVRFGVSATTAPAPVLTTPANNATGASIRPTLVWAAAPGATRYRIELSTSNSFATILETGESNTTSYTTTTLLNIGVQYFWRVRSLNFCGEGALSLTFAFTTGAPGVCPSGTTANIVFQDDVSGDAVAWTTQNISGDTAAQWAKVTPAAGTGLTTRAWFADNSQNAAADQRLITPAINLPSAAQRPLTLAFDAHHQYETDGDTGCWDGGFVEVSTDGGTNWTPLGNARTLTDPYPGTLSGSPAAGNLAWCRQPTPGTPIRTVFNLDGLDGQTVRFRFRSVSDDNTVGPEPNGWVTDNFVVQGCQ